jgi:hypothetical protein
MTTEIDFIGAAQTVTGSKHEDSKAIARVTHAIRACARKSTRHRPLTRPRVPSSGAASLSECPLL